MSVKMTKAQRFQDEGDAAKVAWDYIRGIQAEKHEAPACVDIRSMRGQMGTGPASDDSIMSVWVNDHLRAVFNLFRDHRNYTVLVITDLGALQKDKAT